MNKKTLKILTLLILLAFFIANSFINVYGYWVMEDDMDYSLENPFKSEDIPLFVGQNDDLPKSLSALGEGMLNTQSFRIPSLLYANPHAKSREGALIAAIDRASSGADWGKIDLAVRRSLDNGQSWSDMKIALSMPVNKAPQDSEDWGSSFCIDPAMIQAGDGSIVLLITMYPESKGLHEPKWLEDTSGYVTVDGNQYMALYENDSNVGKNGKKKPVSDMAYTIRENGWVYSPDGIKTNYYVPQIHSSEHNYETLGDMYYAQGEADYISKAPPLVPKEPQDDNRDIYVGNIYLSYKKPNFDIDKPQFVEKLLVAPWKEGKEYSAYQTYETSPAPLRSAVTAYVWMLKSHDNGLTWSQPADITGQIKIEEDGDFLGVCPGVGLILKNQSYANQINRILFPLYRLGKATIVYSDDLGATWQRASSDYIENVDEVQCIELLNGSIMAFGRQETLTRTPVSISLDGGQTWRKVKPTDLYSVKCQKSIISLPIDTGIENTPFAYPEGLEKGRQYVLASHPTGNLGRNSTRTKGVITLGEVKGDHSIEWLYQREIKDYEKYAEMGEYDDFFAYSCMTVLENGNIGLMYEAYPSGYLAYTQFNLNWLMEGGQPVKPKIRISTIVKRIFLGVLLIACGFFIVDIGRKRFSARDNEEFFEGNIEDLDIYSDKNQVNLQKDFLDEDSLLDFQEDEDTKLYRPKTELKEDDLGGIIISAPIEAKVQKSQIDEDVFISRPQQKPEDENKHHDDIPIGAIRIGKAFEDKAKYSNKPRSLDN